MLTSTLIPQTDRSNVKLRIRTGATLLAALLVGATAVTGCSAPTQQAQPGTSPGGEVRTDVKVAITYDADNQFDPTTGWGHGSAALVHSTLVEFNSEMGIVNDLATDYKISDDGLTYTFNMRDDAFFTDGEAVKASDVVFTFMTAKEKKAQELVGLKDVKATGDHQVTFTLDVPNSSFINTLALVGIVPEHAFGDEYFKNPIGSGAWKLVQRNEGEEIILEANTSYYREAPKLQKVTILIMKEDAAFAAATAGEVDVALTSPTHATKEIPGMRLEVVKTLDGRGVTLPTTPDEGKKTESGHAIGNNVTSSLAIRKAMAYALDREAIAKDAVNGFATPAYSENDGMPWNNPEVKIDQDVEYSKKLLADDGWVDADGDGIVEKNGMKAEFDAYYPADDSARQAIGMAAAQQLEAVGVKMNVVGKSWDDISKLMFTNGVIMGWGSADPYTSFMLFYSSNKLKDDFYNPGGFSNPTVDKYMEEALQQTSTEEANKLWQQAQWDGTTGTSMRGDAPWLWMVNPDHLYYVADGFDIGKQRLHGHGASWELMQNLSEWSWK